LIRGCPNQQNIAHQTREQKKKTKHDQAAPKQGGQTVCFMVFGHQTPLVCTGLQENKPRYPLDGDVSGG